MVRGGLRLCSFATLLQSLLVEDSTVAAALQVPGNIRRAEHFVAFLRRFVLYLKEKLGVNQVETENPTTFLAQLQERLNIDGELYHHGIHDGEL